MWVFNKFGEYLKNLLIESIESSMKGVFDTLNANLMDVSKIVSERPDEWNTNIFSFIEEISKRAVLPVAGLILAFIFVMEFIKILNDKNAYKDVGVYEIGKPLFKAFISIEILKRSMSLVLYMFRISQFIIEKASPYLNTTSSIDGEQVSQMLSFLKDESLPSLLGIYLEVQIFKISLGIISVIVFLIVYGRMIEMYLMSAVAPIPFATITSDTTFNFGKNYIKNLAALGLQGFFIIVSVGIFGVLLKSFDYSGQKFSYSVLSLIGYCILLCFSLFKSGSLAKQIIS